MTDPTGHVHATLAKHYPAHVLGWVKRATWKRDPAVPLSRIDMSRRPGGRDPQKVAAIAQAVKDGKQMPPVVLVDTGEAKLQIADGYHRTLGFQHARKAKIPALIASGVGAHGPWEKRMHDAKLNLTAGHVHVIDLAGTCTGPGPCDTTSFGEGKNWVNKVGGLPAYIRAVAHAFRRKGLSESEAIQRAVGVVKNWAEGKGGVTAATRARAAAAVAEWESKKAASHALTADQTATVDLAADPVFATTDGPNLTLPAAGGHRFHHGWVRIDASAPTAVERATRAVTTDGHAMLHGRGMVPTAQKIIERVKTAGHTPTVSRVDVGGTPHLHIARRGSSDYTAAPAVTVDLAFTEALHPRGGKGTAAGGKFVPKNSAPAKGSPLPTDMAANVRDFQRRTGLPVTGVIDTATAAKIQATATSKSGGSAKSKARRAAARKQISQHVTAVNALSPDQRAQYRAKVPTPPAGYVWGKNDTLHRAPNTTALRGVLATIGAKKVAATPAATTKPRSGSGERTAASLTRRRHH